MKQELEIKPGTIYYATNKCLEQFAKAGLWNNKKDLLGFLAGAGVSNRVREVFSVFKERFGDYKIELKNDDRFILLIDFEHFTSNVFGINEEFVILGFLYRDKKYYSYIHASYEKLINEYLPKVL